MQNSVRRIHFLGICGTGMGAVAAAVKDLGIEVTGSDDKVYPPMSTFLESKGIKISVGYRPDNVPRGTSLVVIGNVISRGNLEVEAVLNQKLLYRSLPETLKDFFLHGKKNIVVAGTHGKTTTTSLITRIFQEAGFDPSYFIGGIAKDLGKGAELHDSEYFVLEGDEYDSAFFDKRSKFLHYLPETLVINNLEFDHADIFNNLDEIKTAFRRLVNVVPSQGTILVNADDPNSLQVTEQALTGIETIGFSKSATHQISEVALERGMSSFRLMNEDYQVALIGEFNVRNSAMAVAVALHYNVPIPAIKKALAQFGGVTRRQELRGEVNGIKIIDDFGHHPTAIRETITALRHQYPGQNIWAIFEPRSNTTRRAVFQKEIPAALRLADRVILAEIPRLELLPEQDRLDPFGVVETIKADGVPAFYEPSVAEIIERVRPSAKPGDVIVIFSNGGFDGIHQRLLAELAIA